MATSRVRLVPPRARPSTSWVASSIGRKVTSRRGGCGLRASRAGLASMTPRRTRKRKQLRSAASWRATEAGARPRAWRLATHALHELAALALGTRDAQRHRLGGLALRVDRAGDELAEAAVLHHPRPLAGRALLVGRLLLRPLGARQVPLVLALRVGRAGDELAEAAPALLERLAAVRARLPGLHAALELRHLLLGGLEVLLERRVEVLDGVRPLELALFHLVELGLHLGREGDVHDVLEERQQEIRHLDAELGGDQRAALAVDVAAIVDDGAQDRRVGGRPADPVLLQLLDQRRLGEPRRR